MHANSHSKQEHYPAQDDELSFICHGWSPNRKRPGGKLKFGLQVLFRLCFVI